MTTITTRAGKGSPLLNSEVDANFTNLNTDKAELSGASFTGNVSFGDNDKAIFGSATDLSIYSDGTNSFIQEGSGTSGIRITTDNQLLIRKHDTENIAAFNVDGAVRLYHDNSQVFSTTSTGIDVSGVITTDGMTTSADINFGDEDKALFGAGNDLKIYHSSNNQSYIHEVGSGDLNILATNLKLQDAGGSTKVLVNSTGIDVTGTVTADGLTSAGDAAITGGSSGSTVLTLTTNALADTPLMVFQRSGGAVAGKLAYEDSNTAMSFGTTTAHELKFLTSNTERMQITSAGLVGIGTSSPDAVLTLSTSSSSDVLKLKSSASTTPLKLLFEKSATEQGIIEYNRNGDLELYNTDPDGGVLISGSASADPDLYVSHGGNVGIGTSSPSEKLHVAGALRISNNSADTYLGFGSNSDNYISTASGGATIFRELSTERMRIDSAGRVGIGTSSPAQKITVTNNGTAVYSDAGFTNSSSTSALFMGVGGSAVSNASLRNNAYVLAGNVGSNLILGTDAAERMRIDSSGNVGIGTSSPSAKFGINASAPDFTMLQSDVVKFRSGVSGTTNGGVTGSASGDYFARTSGGKMLFSTNDGVTAHAVIDASGNVGIGTSSPNSYSGFTTLTLDGTSGSLLDLEVNGTVTGEIYADTSFGIGMQAIGSRDMQFKTNNTERMRIDSSGNLLVGTTSSSIYNDTSGNGIQLNGGSGQIVVAKQSSSASDPALWLNNTGVDGSIATFTKDGSPVGSIGSYNGVDLYIGDGEAGLKFSNDNNSIIPWNTSSNASRDNNTDLGGGSDRFRNLYLSSQVYANYIGTLDDTNTTISFPGSDQIRFNNGGSESARFDSSGNLLVGKTNNTLSNDGTIIRAGGELLVTNTSDIVANFNRTGTDGAISTFYKDGTTVGSIANRGTNLSVGSGDVALEFNASNDAVLPASTSTNNTRDAAVDLGISSVRFKDLYLSGVAYANNFVGVSDTDTGIDINGTNVMKFNTGGSERMRIDSSGNLLVGTTSLADVNNIVTNHLFEGANSTAGAGAVGVYNNTGTANCPALVVLNRDTSTDTSNRFIQFYADVSSSSSTAMGGIVGNGASNVQFAALSDAREKTNIESISGSLDKINTLNPVEFDWIASGEHVSAGFVAQEVEQVFPEFVVENMADEGAEERKGLTGGMTGGIVAHLVKAIQEQNELINDLRARVAQLETN